MLNGVVGVLEFISGAVQTLVNALTTLIGHNASLVRLMVALKGAASNFLGFIPVALAPIAVFGLAFYVLMLVLHGGTSRD